MNKTSIPEKLSLFSDHWNPRIVGELKNNKYLLLIFLFSISIFSQNKIVGKYQDGFGSSIKIFSDSTFLYEWNFDLAGSWTQGQWYIRKENLILKPVLVYDTIINYNGTQNDTIVLSPDKKGDIINQTSFIMSLLSSGGQNRQLFPLKYIIRKKKLIAIDGRGERIRQKNRVFRAVK